MSTADKAWLQGKAFENGTGLQTLISTKSDYNLFQWRVMQHTQRRLGPVLHRANQANSKEAGSLSVDKGAATSSCSQKRANSGQGPACGPAWYLNPLHDGVQVCTQDHAWKRHVEGINSNYGSTLLAPEHRGNVMAPVQFPVKQTRRHVSSQLDALAI